MIRLSIAIPTYSRTQVTMACIKMAINSIYNNCNKVEIVVSSDEINIELKDFISELRLKHLKLNIVYIENERDNTSSTFHPMVRNFFRTIEACSGEFCWMIGNDDFLKSNAVNEILEVIENNEIDLIVTALTRYKISTLEQNDYSTLEQNLNGINLDKSELKKSFFSKNYFDLIGLEFNNVFLGSHMVNIFRKKLWNKFDFDFEYSEILKFTEGMYIQCYIFAKYFSKSSVYYNSIPLIIAGDGVREWSTNKNKNFWQSEDLWFYVQVIPKILIMYKKFGMKNTKFITEMNKYSISVGSILFLLIIRKINGKNFLNQDKINVIKIIKWFMFFPNFYLGLIKGIIILILNKSELYNS